MKKHSKNQKLNKVLTAIEQQLLNMCDTHTESLQEVKHYMKEYSQEPDYNIAQHGNVSFTHYDIRDMYMDAGYISMSRYSDNKVWNIYLRQVGYIARQLTR